MLRLFALSHVKSTAPKLCAAALPYFKFNRSYAQPNAFDDDDIDAEFFDDDLDFLDELFDENLEDVFADFSGDVSHEYLNPYGKKHICLRQAFRTMAFRWMRAKLRQPIKKGDWFGQPQPFMEKSDVSLLAFDTPQTASSEQIVAFLTSHYIPEVYAYAICDVADIRSAALQLHQVPLTRKATRRLLISPLYFIKNPNALYYYLGEERAKEFILLLQHLLEAHDASSQSILYQCPTGSVCPQLPSFLRGVALADAIHHPLVLQLSYVVDQLLQTGSVGPSLYVEGDYNERGVFLARWFMKIAKEFGSSRLLSASLLLMGRFDLPVRFDTSRQIALALSRMDRREMDWKLKLSRGERSQFTPNKGW